MPAVSSSPLRHGLPPGTKPESPQKKEQGAHIPKASPNAEAEALESMHDVTDKENIAGPQSQQLAPQRLGPGLKEAEQVQAEEEDESPATASEEEEEEEEGDASDDQRRGMVEARSYDQDEKESQEGFVEYTEAAEGEVLEAAGEQVQYAYTTEDGTSVVFVEGVGWVAAQEGSDGQLYCLYEDTEATATTTAGDGQEGEGQVTTAGLVEEEGGPRGEEEKGEEAAGGVLEELRALAEREQQQELLARRALEAEEEAELARLAAKRQEQQGGKKAEAAREQERARLAEEQLRREREWEAQMAEAEQEYMHVRDEEEEEEEAAAAPPVAKKQDLLSSLLASKMRLMDQETVPTASSHLPSEGATIAVPQQQAAPPSSSSSSSSSSPLKQQQLDPWTQRPTPMAVPAMQQQAPSPPAAVGSSGYAATEPAAPPLGGPPAPPPLSAVPKYRPPSPPRHQHTGSGDYYYSSTTTSGGDYYQQRRPEAGPAPSSSSAAAMTSSGGGGVGPSAPPQPYGDSYQQKQAPTYYPPQQGAPSTARYGYHNQSGAPATSGNDAIMDGPHFRDQSGYRSTAPSFSAPCSSAHPGSDQWSDERAYRGPFDRTDAFFNDQRQQQQPSRYAPAPDPSAMARAYRGGPYDYQQQREGGGADPYDMRRVSNSRHDAVARPHGIPNHFDREQEEASRRSRTALSMAYGGVLTFCMYGTTEATDSALGQAYTEYILQLHWGPDKDSLRPWIVARRYREFYALDTSLRATFPDLESQLPLLPPKEWLFTSLSPHVVYRRQRAFEVYLSHIVMNLPVVLRSALVDRFLLVTDRVDKIRRDLALPPLRDLDDTPTTTTTTTRAPTAPSQMPDPPARGAYDAPTPSVASSRPDRQAPAGPGSSSSSSSAGSVPPVVYGVDVTRLSGEAAQQAYEQQRPLKVDERELWELEGLARDLQAFLRRTDPKAAATTDFMRNHQLQNLLIKVSGLWPRLKALTNDLDFDAREAQLIPRALQCDEDLTRLAADLRSIIALRYADRAPAVPQHHHKASAGDSGGRGYQGAYYRYR